MNSDNNNNLNDDDNNNDAENKKTLRKFRLYIRSRNLCEDQKKEVHYGSFSVNFAKYFRAVSEAYSEPYQTSNTYT